MTLNFDQFTDIDASTFAIAHRDFLAQQQITLQTAVLVLKRFATAQIIEVVTVTACPFDHFLTQILARFNRQFGVIHMEDVIVNDGVLGTSESLQSRHPVNLGWHAHIDFREHLVNVLVVGSGDDFGHTASDIVITKGTPKSTNASGKDMTTQHAKGRISRKNLQEHQTVTQIERGIPTSQQTFAT
jgi:hypothetical protein